MAATGSFYTHTKQISLEAHAAQEDGLGVVIGADSNHYMSKSAAPGAGAAIDYVTTKTAAAAGDELDVAVVGLGEVVQLRADAVVAYGAKVAVKTNGRFITGVATNVVQYKAVQAAVQGSVFSAVRIEQETIA
ncbi:hypothetical protein NVP1271B_25 [Vibrio phage 1.271.B._10N.286.54.B4]|nr:hypothetical protein NVP1027O_25 [Vibrio phage 1.027.O._10N.286.54.B8]AUR94405.1 hypothetical protein NVP1194O_25 [Vibrio phage 1.194.O._10N.286.54.B1]AUR94490.1 hypothetical protein NVP1195O_25 [Vibrio phage 1.195.O._10N.286.54.C8]AUR94578.1 hypothetical protein NVP1196O_25 [Vibrio phage 1.196.O._10N.286.54.E12]AUR95045.1 hypothetical protein NVP1200O_25 [Vibrio phage 1.200.O._10N.286.55.E1]AUR99533.1 hypothetical protein NVP1267O_25 [Vibrio phage 1.267.O._10N.286.54.A1]AUR99788.1 hypothe